jgi:hypothetical protein
VAASTFWVAASFASSAARPLGFTITGGVGVTITGWIGASKVWVYSSTINLGTTIGGDVIVISAP